MRSSSTPQAQGYAALILLSQIRPSREKEVEGSKKGSHHLCTNFWQALPR